MIFFKKSKIVLDCFLPESFSYVKEYAPIQSASKFYPQWWKELEIEHFDFDKMHAVTNMKSCQGFVNVFRHGFILPLWSDFSLKIDENGFYQYSYSDMKSSLDAHPNEQAGQYYKDYYFFKIISPWLIDSNKKDLYVNVMPCIWNHTEPTPYITPYGITNFNSNPGTNIFLLLKKEPQKIFIDYKTPMLHFIPITEKEIVLRHHVITDIEFNKKNSEKSIPLTFNRKQINQDRVKQGKCPLKTFIKNG